VAEMSRRRVRDRRDRSGVLRAFRGTAVANVYDCVGRRRRTHVGGVHARHTRAVRKPEGEWRNRFFFSSFRFLRTCHGCGTNERRATIFFEIFGRAVKREKH